MFLNNLVRAGVPRRRVGGATAPDAEPEALPLPECTRLCSGIDAISIIIKGAGSPFKEGSHVGIIHARQRSKIRIGL